MRKFVVSVLLITGIIAGVNAAAPVARGRSGSQSAAPVSAARSATPTVAARAATTQTARSAVSQNRTVAARAGTTQKVINSGTKIAGATQNTAVNEECQNKYFGCMDAFCMLDNTSGGRCICSNRNAELDAVLAEIEQLDEQSYQMATLGVEQIEMGENADAAIAKANAVADSAIKSSEKKARKSLDLSMWDSALDLDSLDDEIFLETGTLQSTIDGKTGDALHRAASELCVAQIPECASESSMLQLLYAQRIKSDCSAYENSLKQRKSASQTKLSSAQKALREAALEQLQSANKYDLGQCTIQFKKCMQTTGECGDDFSNCASVAAFDNTNVKKSTSKKTKNYSIKGDVTTIEITASTYDTLIAKKPLCDTVTKSCVAVADKVWETFLREVAPALKSAELIAEDNARQNCIGNISQCFQKACKDNIDPNDPDGSYDMCLTRPETMLNLCKIPLNACGIDASSKTAAEKSKIWDFVVARLASMRVDSCTKEVKACLQSDDRCGKDYTQCIGLDMPAILDMCPQDKLVGCQESTKDGVIKNSLSDISKLVMGIFLDIDNKMLDMCQNALTTKMLEICGDTSSCAAFDDDDTIGTDSLMSYKDGDGSYVIDGLISFGAIKMADKNIDVADYKEHLIKSVTGQRIVAALQTTANRINQKVVALSQDPQIQKCVEGRNMSQVRQDGEQSTARFPNLIDSSVNTIMNAGLTRASQNYNKKYNQLVGKAMESQSAEIKAVTCAAMASSSAPLCVKFDDEGKCVKYEINKYENVFSGTESTESGTTDIYATSYKIAGVSLSNITRVAETGHSEYIQTDDYGNYLGNVIINAVYSPATQTCTITTETVVCKDAEATSTYNDYGKLKKGYTIYDARGNIVAEGTKLKNSTIETYQGTSCKEFGDPVVNTTIIEM